MKKLYATFLATVIGLGFSASVRAELLVASVGPTSGQFAVLGEQLRQGARQAVDDINAQGGINGEKLVFEMADDACEDEQALATANRLTGRGAALVVGHFCSESSIAASPVYVDSRIVQISPATSNPRFTDERPGPGIYRVYGRSDQQGAVIGKMLADKFGIANIAVAQDGTAYGKGLAEATRSALAESGKKEVLYEQIEAGQNDYSDLIDKLKRSEVDVLFFSGYHNEAAVIARQIQAAGLTTQLIAGDSLFTDDFWLAAGDAGEGTLVAAALDPRTLPANTPLSVKFRENEVEPEGYVYYAYAAVEAWAEAVRAAGSSEYEAVVEQLNSGTYDTVLGEMSFDDKGDTSLPSFVFYRWQNGNLTILR
ncbi:MAG: branched-chain amino acid ABC transporter substrate-binding protein [Stappiaceae bacterium]